MEKKFPILRLANKETETKLHRTVETGGRGGPSSKEKGGKLSQRWDFLTSPIVEVKLKKEKEKKKTAKCVTHKGPDEKAQNKRNDRRRKKTKRKLWNEDSPLQYGKADRRTERERGVFGEKIMNLILSSLLLATFHQIDPTDTEMETLKSGERGEGVVGQQLSNFNWSSLFCVDFFFLGREFCGILPFLIRHSLAGYFNEDYTVLVSY